MDDECAAFLLFLFQSFGRRRPENWEQFDFKQKWEPSERLRLDAKI